MVNDLNLKTKVRPIFRGYINEHIVENEKVYNMVISLLKAIQRNSHDLNIIYPDRLIADLIYVMNFLHEDGGTNDLKYVKRILLPKLETVSNMSDLTPVMEDLIGYRGFYALTRLRNALLDNLYTSWFQKVSQTAYLFILSKIIMKGMYYD